MSPGKRMEEAPSFNDADAGSMNALGNVTLSSDHVLCTINPKIYPIELVYSAAYIMIDKAYILLDGDPDTEIKVEIRSKKVAGAAHEELMSLAIEFNEQLLNYAVYKVQSERNKNIREIMLQKALFTHAPRKAAAQFAEMEEEGLRGQGDDDRVEEHSAEQEAVPRESH